MIIMSEFWKTKVKMTCVEKHGKCHHEVGESARVWVSHCAAGVPSWEGDDPSVYMIHCISKKGTVWKLEKVAAEEE